MFFSVQILFTCFLLAGCTFVFMHFWKRVDNYKLRLVLIFDDPRLSPAYHWLFLLCFARKAAGSSRKKQKHRSPSICCHELCKSSMKSQLAQTGKLRRKIGGESCQQRVECWMNT